MQNNQKSQNPGMNINIAMLVQSLTNAEKKNTELQKSTLIRPTTRLERDEHSAFLPRRAEYSIKKSRQPACVRPWFGRLVEDSDEEHYGDLYTKISSSCQRYTIHGPPNSHEASPNFRRLLLACIERKSVSCENVQKLYQMLPMFAIV